MAAGYLDTDDLILSLDGDYGAVESVVWIADAQPMYNLTVAEVSTFAVGDGQWVVHNCVDFVNQLPEQLATELKTADKLGVKVIRVGEEGWEKQLDNLVNSSDATGTVKWAVDADGNLLIIPHEVQGVEINHTVLTRGGNVLAAGEANIAGFGQTFFGIEISRHSGHYLPSEESLTIGVQAFEKFGITFKNVNPSLD